ncbi:MAG: ligase-associated DNA damage response endonuclease PdeM [Pseudomonadota bacterium]
MFAFCIRMQAHDFTLCRTGLSARASGALWWPAERLLCVADLHLGKSDRIARLGGSLLPPYETDETLSRLADEIAALDPACVICLGDSFDDAVADRALPDEARLRLSVMMAGRRWIWVTGNHDPVPPDLPGSALESVEIGPICFRHCAVGGARGEVSGHWHPKASIALRGRRVTRPAFVIDPGRVILPAFGAYTGGLDIHHPDLAAFAGPDTVAVLTGKIMLAVPLSRCLGLA